MPDELNDLQETLEQAWSKLQDAHLMLSGDVSKPSKHIDDQLSQLEEATRQYWRALQALQKARKLASEQTP